MFNKKILILVSIVLVFLSGGFLIYQTFVESEKVPSESILTGNVKIQADRDTYTPILSSTVGIGLTPIYTSGRYQGTVKFHWHTSYGHFISWEPPDFKVNLLGAEVINDGEKIFWSYDPEMDIKKPPVKISLKIEDAESGQLLTESTLEIDWVDQNIAKIDKQIYLSHNTTG